MKDAKHPVLVAVDFSDDSRAALHWAAQYAAQFKLPLTILHVLHDPLDDPGFYRKDHPDPSVPMEDIARRMLKDFVTDLTTQHEGLEVLNVASLRLVKGVPENRIVEIAQEINAQHIVVGRQGRSRLKHILVGSKTRAVTQATHLPVTSITTRNEDQRIQDLGDDGERGERGERGEQEE